MDDSFQERVIVTKHKVGLFTYIGDFFNTFKAFIGTNYLSMAFAFAQSGIIFGIVGVFLIATLTDFCCQLLIKCKYLIIDRLIDEDTAHRPLSAVELSALRQKLEQSIRFGDVGRLAFGRWCEVVINLTVVFTQFLTTVCYFIFIGNAIFTIFPMEPAMVPLNRSNKVVNASLNRFGGLVNGIPLLSIDNIGHSGGRKSRAGLVHTHGDVLGRHRRALNGEPHSPDNFAIIASQYVNPNATNSATTTEPPVTTPEGNTTTAKPAPTTPVPTPAMFEKSIAPSLIFLVMTPLPIFLCTSLIRNMRVLSPVTVIASFSLFVGAIAVLVFLFVGFTVKPGFRWIRFETLPLFIGQLTSAYEGIGCVLPIESSMEGNRYVFPMFLHLSIYLVFLVLTAFGVSGYLRYGDGVEQIIILSIPQHSWLAVAIDVTLIISVACTFPLQMFPTIQIAESFCFGPGMCCAPPPPELLCDDDHGSLINEDPGAMERSTDSFVSHSGHEVPYEIPNTVPTWKRNVLRVVITLLTMVCGIGVRNSYAYVAAFSGAVGCSLLAFILPCAIHIQLQRNEMHIAHLLLDLVIIFLAVVCSILVLVVITYKIVESGF